MALAQNVLYCCTHGNSGIVGVKGFNHPAIYHTKMGSSDYVGYTHLSAKFTTSSGLRGGGFPSQEYVKYNVLETFCTYPSYLFSCRDLWQQESPADAVKPARRKSMQKLLQFDVFRFISPNSISPNFKV